MTFGKKHPVELYIGGKSLTKYYPKNPILASDQAFGAYFDASTVWGTLSGRMFYAGVRYKIR